jgi:hypothetical protein
MGEKIVFVDGDRIGITGENGTRLCNSEYLDRYRQNVRSIKERNAWKNEGTGAAYRLEKGMQENQEPVRTAVNGVACLREADRIAYSVSSTDYSGIFIKSMADEAGPEGHVVHNAKLDFGSLDYDPKSRQLAVSVRAGDIDKHIAVLDIGGGGCRTLTGGDSVDESPCWSATAEGIIYYASCGIGRDMGGNFRGYGPSAIMRLDTRRREVEEVLASEKFDYLLPREDGRGNLYFIRRPYAGARNRTMTFADVIFVPFKILRGFFKFLEFFTHKYTGDTFSSRGVNPAMSRERNERDVFVNGNLINAEKTLKENMAKGEKFPGIAPMNWQLMRRTPDGEEAVKKGVLDYDIAEDGVVVYSNGKFVVRLGGGAEEKIERRDMAVKLRVMG